ncbi:MAG TPA: TRZ/ATZ family hydrolase [Casimicrobiaceae bacterium]|nr:TRZ/ATZ family hydrolase [Casimicrobiaceae bacterium]
MQTADLRIDAGWIVPIEPAGVLREHALLVSAGRIAAIVPVAEADRGFAARERIVLDDHVLIPGLVNAHTHAAMSLFRGIADDVPLKIWLEDQIWPREGRFVSPEFVYDGARLAAAEMLLGGITCCNDMYFFPDATARAFVELGMRGMLGMPILDFPTAYASDADGYLQTGLAIRDEWKREPELAFSLAPHAPYTVSDATWKKIVVFARQLDLPIQTHLAETAQEHAQSVAQHGYAPLARLHELGATGPQFIGIHGVHLADADIALLAMHGGHVVHCPVSNMKLGAGVAPVAALLASGVNVALGTDGAASNNRLDLLSELRIAALLAKVATGDPSVLPAAQALEVATLGGARALGLDKEIGSLVAGKQADLVAVDLSGLDASPCYDPISHLVHAVGRDAVSDVWVAGRRVVSGGALATADEAAIAARARLWQERLE